jgi:hypothetical protein
VGQNGFQPLLEAIVVFERGLRGAALSRTRKREDEHPGQRQSV